MEPRSLAEHLIEMLAEDVTHDSDYGKIDSDQLETMRYALNTGLYIGLHHQGLAEQLMKGLQTPTTSGDLYTYPDGEIVEELDAWLDRNRPLIPESLN